MAATIAATAMDVDERESWLESVNGGEGEAAGDGPARGEYEGLTVRSVCLGLVLGSVTTVENIYFALKYGWTVSNNLTAAILGFVVVMGWRRAVPSAPEFTPQENCVLMTTAVAATAMVWGGSMPFAILAMSAEIRDAVGFENDAETWEPTIPRLLVYAASLCFIGFSLAIPLARKYVVDEPLPFPYALAAAKTIEGLHDGGDDGAPRFLLRTTLPAVAFAMGSRPRGIRPPVSGYPKDFFKILVPPSDRTHFPRFLDRSSSIPEVLTTGVTVPKKIRSETLAVEPYY